MIECRFLCSHNRKLYVVMAYNDSFISILYNYTDRINILYCRWLETARVDSCFCTGFLTSVFLHPGQLFDFTYCAFVLIVCIESHYVYILEYRS